MRVAARVAARTTFAFGLRPGYERYSLTRAGSPACLDDAIVPCKGAGVGFTLDQDIFRLGLPLSYRLGAPRVKVSPYLTIEPQLLFVHSQVSLGLPTGVSGEGLSGGATDVVPAVSGLLGVGFAAGPGTFFIEAGLRYAPVRDRATGEPTNLWVVSGVGFRLVR